VLGIPQFEEKYYKAMKGREIHDEKLEKNKDYLRKKIGVKEKFLDVYLTNNFLRGKVDEVLILKDETMAPLDYKFAEYKEILFNTYRTQSASYALLIEENYSKFVNKGYIVFTRSKNKLVEIQITDNDKNKVRNCINEITKIIDNNYYPKGTKTKLRCEECTYRNLCIK
jgi:CRISPR-associated exonuclease Cas4